MKIYMFIIMAIFASCGSQYSNVKSGKVLECPEDGACSFEILKNKVLVIKQDEFGNRYPQVEDGKATVLKYEYQRNEIPDTVDGHYRELIYLQLDSNQPELQLEDELLQNAKLLFGRLCFCRGQTGYYPITKGRLSVDKIDGDGDSYRLKLNFKCDEVPQVVERIDVTFTL